MSLTEKHHIKSILLHFNVIVQFLFYSFLLNKTFSVNKNDNSFNIFVTQVSRKRPSTGQSRAPPPMRPMSASQGIRKRYKRAFFLFLQNFS